MNVFQWIALPALGLVLAAEMVGLFRRSSNRWFRVVRCLVWMAAGLAIYNPALTVLASKAVGIDRGTDLVLYVFVLAFLVVSFAFYARSVRVERQLTDVVRHVAIQEARKGPERTETV